MFPARGDDLKFDGKRQVIHQSLDHGHLLKIFLTEKSHMWTDEMKKLGYHDPNPIEMTRSKFSLQHSFQIAKIHFQIWKGWIHRGDFRHKSIINSQRFELAKVGIQGVRIFLKVLRIIKLSRIDKNRNDHPAISACCLASASDSLPAATCCAAVA